MSDRRIALLLLMIVCVAALALGVALAWHSSQSQLASPVGAVGSSTAPPATPGHCHSVDGLPDRACTPGAIDPRVTQANILTTICVSGYTTKVRPSTEYTNSLKRRQISEYGYADTNLGDYEEDHLIPLELGGSPTDPKNLWPEPRSGPYPATKKDGVENSLHTNVCAGMFTLAAAQHAIATDWKSVP